MALLLKQSTSVDVALGPFVDSDDGVTPLTALTITQPDVRLKKNGGAWAQKAAAQTLAHEENGWYEVTLDATDTNTLGLLRVAVHEAGALPVWQDFMVVPANVYDSLVSGSDALDVSLIQWLGAAPNALQSGRVDSYLGAAASGVLAAANFAAGALDAVWSTATRLLTAGTNIVLAKGAGVTGFTDLDAAGVRSAVGLASDNLDAQLGAIDDLLDTEIAAIKTDTAAIKSKTDSLPTDPADESSIQAAVAAVSAFVDTEVGAVKAVTDKLDTALELDGSEYRFTTNALEQATPGSGPSAADVADAVWDEPRAGHTTPDTFGEGVSSVRGGVFGNVNGDIDGDLVGHVGGNVLGSVALIQNLDPALYTRLGLLKEENVETGIDGTSFTVFGDYTAAKGNLVAVFIGGGAFPETRVVADAVFASGETTFTVDRPFSATPGITNPVFIYAANSPKLDSSLRVALSEDSLLDLADGVESGVTLRQALRGVIAVLLGKASGMATTTATFRDTNDTKDRVTATVDSSGNRTAVSTDLT